jgi:hypothetical protein
MLPKPLPSTGLFWRLIYLLIGISCITGGYRNLSPERTAHTNADWIFVTVILVLMCLFPLGAMAYSRSIGVETFRRPSFDRWPLGWWRDTLQPLRVSLVSIALTFMGSCLALPKADQRGVMIVWSYAAATVGLFIGERLVYRVYSKRIV